MYIQRHFIQLPEGQIHYRRIGKGSTLVMIHEMPLSSKVFIPLMNELQDEFDCIAIDLPNYGDSEWITNDLAIPDYANIVHNVLEKLNIQNYSIYGVHGGASIALDIAAKFENEVCSLILSGVPLFTEEERLKLHAGLNPLIFEDHGRHFQVWWDNFRKKWDPITPAKIIHNAVMDIMKAGKDYDVGYRAAFDYDPYPALTKVQVPIFLPIAVKDPLFSKNSKIIEMKNNSSEMVIDVPQHISQVAAEQLANGIRNFVKNIRK